MRLDGTVHCEGPDCEHHWYAGMTRFQNRTLIDLPSGWLLLTQFSERPIDDLIFCGKDCLMRWAAQFDPEEEVPA